MWMLHSFISAEKKLGVRCTLSSLMILRGPGRFMPTDQSLAKFGTCVTFYQSLPSLWFHTGFCHLFLSSFGGGRLAGFLEAWRDSRIPTRVLLGLHNTEFLWRSSQEKKNTCNKESLSKALYSCMLWFLSKKKKEYARKLLVFLGSFGGGRLARISRDVTGTVRIPARVCDEFHG